MGSFKYIGDSILKDNDIELLLNILMILDFSDCCYNIIIDQKKDVLTVHIHPSSQDFKKDIIDNLLSLSKIVKTKIIFSKSLGISQTVSFTINT